MQIILIAADYGWKQNLRLFPPGTVSKRKIPPFPSAHAVSRRENHAASELHSEQIIGFPVRRLFLRRKKTACLTVPPAPLSGKNRKAWRRDNVLSLPPSCRKCYSGAYCSNG
ncbi:hypothetical protein CXU01_07255 [Akkermansia muciniphila]|nr:hypothetical protein CXU01_07255 [Akkermansia muciniphila]